MGPTEQILRFSICHPTYRQGGRGQKYQFLRRSPCRSTVGLQVIQPFWILAAHLYEGPTGRSARLGFLSPSLPAAALCGPGSGEPAGAVRLVPPLGLIIYVSASGPPRTWQGLPAVFGNTLCRAPAGPALLPAAGARPVRGVWVAGAPWFPYPARSHEPPRAPTHLSSVPPSHGRAVRSSPTGWAWVTPRVIERFRKMRWPILKQSPIISAWCYLCRVSVRSSGRCGQPVPQRSVVGARRKKPALEPSDPL